MPAKIQKTKSRTSKSKLSKKNSAPRWVIGVVLAIVVATGAFLVYNSFASTNPALARTLDGAYVSCDRGYCGVSYIRGASGILIPRGNQHGKTCTRVSKSVRYLCT
jgi:hypothetical protein